MATTTPAPTDEGQTDNGQQTEPNKTAEDNGYTPPASQEEFNKILGERLRAERAKFADYEELKSKAAKFDEADDAQKTEVQKATESLEKERRRAEQAESRALSLQIATEFKLGADDAALLAELPDEESKRKLAERLAKQAAAGDDAGQVGYSVDHSRTQSTPPPSKDDAARSFFGI